MVRRKAFTLLEIIVSVASMSLLVVVMYQTINSTVIYTVSGINNVKAQDEIKYITETLRLNVASATELYILKEVPDIKDNTYEYFYSKDGVVYYYNMGENVVDMSDDISNNIQFEADDGSKILKYSVSATRKNINKLSNSSIYIDGIINGINKPKEKGSVNHSANCIMFRVHSDVAVITNFTLNNDAYNQTLDMPVHGMIQEGVISLYVPEKPSKTDKNYTPTVTFVGDKVVVSNTKLDNLEDALNKQAEVSNGYELEKREINFDSPVYYYVIANENVKEYEVRLIVGNTDIKIYQQGRNGETITDVLRFDRDFYVNGIHTSGTLQWFTEGCTEPVKEVGVSASDTNLTLSKEELYKNNDPTTAEEEEKYKKYNYKNQSEYEDVMRYITVKFTPTVSSEPVYATPKLIYPVSEKADSQIIGEHEDDFYFKVATDIWIESKSKDTFSDSWLSEKTGEDAVKEFKEMYEAVSGEPYNKVAKLNTNRAPDFVRVMYHVNRANYTVEPMILAIGDTTAYSRTVFGVDLKKYGIPDKILDSYEVSATYIDSGFEKINGTDTVNIKNNDENLDACVSIGIFTDDNMNGFRAVAGVTEASGYPNGYKGYVKSANYKDDRASEDSAVGSLNIMQEYALDGAWDVKNETPITFSLKTFRQNNDENTILYYANVEDANGIRVGALEDKYNMNIEKGKPKIVGEGGESIPDMLVGDNFYAGYSINTMRTGGGTTTTGNVITFGMAVNKDIGSKYAQYITDIKFSAASEYALELKGATVIGHTIIDDMITNGQPKTATIVELQFNNDVRSGYDSNSTDNANVDTSIVDSITNKHKKIVDINNGKYTTIVKEQDKYIQNLVADSGYISFSNDTKTFNVLSTTDKQYAYKTANGDGENTWDTITVLVDGELENGKTYNINLKKGSIRAVHGGDVEIDNKGITVKGIPVNIDKSEITVFNISEDVFKGDGKPVVDNTITYNNGEYQYNGSQFINNVNNSVGAGGNGSQHYQTDMFEYTFGGEGVTSEKGFIMEATTKRIVDYNTDAPRNESHVLMGKSGGTTYRYALHVADVRDGTETRDGVSFYSNLKYTQEKMSALLIISTKGDNILYSNGKLLNGNNDYINDDANKLYYNVNSIVGRLYFRRKPNVDYTFRATFEGNYVTVQILDENGDIVPTFKKTTMHDNKYNEDVLVATSETEKLENGYKFEIPEIQRHNGIKYDKIGFRAGGGSYNYGSQEQRIIYNKDHGFVIKSLK